MTRPDRTLIAVALGASLLLVTPPEGRTTTPPTNPGSSGSGIPLRDRPRTPTTAEEMSKVAVVSVSPTRPLGSTATARHSVSGLQVVLDRLEGPARIILQPGHHDLVSIPYEDPACGGCADPKERAKAGYGLRITGEAIEIVGASRESVFVHTNAGYGILFESCKNCLLSGVTITGGARDADPNATDAGIVVRTSLVTIEHCDIRDNVGDPAAGAGIAGIAAREKSDVWIHDCRIVGNSGDGVALYRGARAFIRDNLIDGADGSGAAAGASGGSSGGAGGAGGPGGGRRGGRGVGILLRWDANATVEGNLVTRYWKGIGVFEDARATVKQNIVEDVVLWGIAYSDGGRGRPIAEIRENAIYLAGGCGGWIERKDTEGKRPGTFADNAVVMTGQMEALDPPDSTFRREAIAAVSVPPRFRVRDNLFFANREAGGAAGRLDLPEAKFRAEVRDLVERLAKRPALESSRFMRSFSTP